MITTARRRRVRRLQAVVGGTAALLVVASLAVSLGGADGEQTIGVTDGGQVSAVGKDRGATPDPLRSDDDRVSPTSAPGSAAPGEPSPTSEPSEPSERSTAPTPSPRAEPSGGTVSTAPTPRSSPSGTAEPGPQPQPTPSRQSPRPTPAAPTREPSPEASGEMRRTYSTSAAGGTFCQRGTPWCGDSRAAGSGPVDFSIQICRSAEAGPGTLSVSAAPADFMVHRGEDEVWRWSAGKAFPAVQETLEFKGGDCYEWSTTWRGVDGYNRPLPAGRYLMKASFSSDEFPAAYEADVYLD